jgi:predicted MFS family arabinose efflux permease
MAADVVGDDAEPLRPRADLRIPAANAARETVDEHERRAPAGDFVVERDAVDVGARHPADSTRAATTAGGSYSTAAALRSARMPLPAALRAFRHRDFRLFWAAQLVSLCGTWMQSLGQAWLVLELTHSPLRLGVVSALQFGPFLVFSFVAGVVVDRVRKRRLLLVTQAALAVQAAILAALVQTGHIRYWHVATLALCAGIANTLDMPARQAFIVDIVGRDDLLNAVALNSAVFNAARAIGPALAGVLIAEWGVAGAFAFNAVSFLAPIVSLVLIRTDGYGGPRARRPLLEEMGEGVAYAARSPRVGFIFALLLTVSLFVFNYNVMVPLFARQVLHVEARGLGFLMSSLGGGALVGAIVLAIASRQRPSRAAIVSAGVVLSATALAMSAVRDFRVAAGLLFVMGLAGIIFMASCNTTVQLGVPDALRGRVMGLYSFVFVGVTPIGSFLMGTIAEHAGVAESYLVGGLGSLLGITVVMAWWSRRR